MKTTKRRSKEEQAEIVKRALSTPKTDSAKAPACWNCFRPMTETKDINGAEVFVCDPCTRSSEDPEIPDSVRAWVVEEVRSDAGKLRAVKICSALLDAELWVLAEPDFFPPDGEPVFFHDELSFLAEKSADQLKEILKVKVAFPRCRVVQ